MCLCVAPRVNSSFVLRAQLRSQLAATPVPQHVHSVRLLGSRRGIRGLPSSPLCMEFEDTGKRTMSRDVLLSSFLCSCVNGINHFLSLSSLAQQQTTLLVVFAFAGTRIPCISHCALPFSLSLVRKLSCVCASPPLFASFVLPPAPPFFPRKQSRFRFAVIIFIYTCAFFLPFSCIALLPVGLRVFRRLSFSLYPQRCSFSC
jgi:hypothetical protein